MSNVKFVENKTLVSKTGNIENYFHTPVLKNGEPVGVVTNAVEMADGFLVTYYTWEKPTVVYSENGGVSSINI